MKDVLRLAGITAVVSLYLFAGLFCAAWVTVLPSLGLAWLIGWLA
jgi:hypothetical protein